MCSDAARDDHSLGTLPVGVQNLQEFKFAVKATVETRNRGRLNNSKNSRRPGADHSPRPTQKRPPPANPTLPPPAPRAPPRACSKAVGGTDTIPVKRHRGEPGHTYGTHGRIQAHPTPNGQDTLLFAISMSPMRSARDSTHERRRTNTQTLKRSKTQLPLARRREAPSLGISSNISKFRYHADHPSFIHSSWPTSTLSISRGTTRRGTRL